MFLFQWYFDPFFENCWDICQTKKSFQETVVASELSIRNGKYTKISFFHPISFMHKRNRNLVLLPEFHCPLFLIFFVRFVKLVFSCLAFVLFVLLLLRSSFVNLVLFSLICLFYCYYCGTHKTVFSYSGRSSQISVLYQSFQIFCLLLWQVYGIGRPFCCIICAPSFRLIVTDRTLISLLL